MLAAGSMLLATSPTAPSTVGATVTCVDYDASAVEHTRRRYPELTMIAGNLVDLPLPDESVDVVVNFQVIEHLWDQAAFIAECNRSSTSEARTAPAHMMDMNSYMLPQGMRPVATPRSTIEVTCTSSPATTSA